jgi:hypothetical protein
VVQRGPATFLCLLCSFIHNIDGSLPEVAPASFSSPKASAAGVMGAEIGEALLLSPMRAHQKEAAAFEATSTAAPPPVSPGPTSVRRTRQAASAAAATSDAAPAATAGGGGGEGEAKSRKRARAATGKGEARHACADYVRDFSRTPCIALICNSHCSLFLQEARATAAALSHQPLQTLMTRR